jgi:hypothetical protein
MRELSQKVPRRDRIMDKEVWEPDVWDPREYNHSRGREFQVRTAPTG